MGALNAPVSERQIPENARGNPVYEQTRQDMPLWCCGRNCGRNSRITVFILGFIGICSSSIVCLSPHYFRFVSLRNDTFTHAEKMQPKPFEYAVEANVGLFRYQILEVYEYPWPPLEEVDNLDRMHNRELERLAKFDSENDQFPGKRLLQNKFPPEFFDDDDGVKNNVDATDDDESSTPSGNITVHQNDTMDILSTQSPADSPVDFELEEVPEPLPGSSTNNSSPTTTPTSSPTGGNPNDNIDVQIGVVLPYPAGHELDKLFKNGQSGAMWAPILATIGLIFASIEFFCCIYKCSWLPTAIFLYTAFMLQLMTMFLFMTEDFCDYTQDCWLGSAGYMSVIAVVCYLICQSLVCMTPRPPPKYNLLKKPPVRRKKKKRRKPNEFEDDEPESMNGSNERFADESSFAGNSGYMDPYDEQDPYSSHYSDSQYGDTSNSYGDGYDNDYGNGYGGDYNDGYDQGGYNDGYNEDGYNDGYDGYDGSYDTNNQSSNEISDQRGYGDDSHMYDGYDNDDQGGYDNSAQTHDDYNEKYEEAPSSTSSRRRK